MKYNKYGIDYIYFIGTTLICSIPFFLYLLGFRTNYNNSLIDLSNINIINELGEQQRLSPLLKGKFIHTLIVGFSITIAFVTTILSFIDYFIKRNVSTPIVGVALFCAGLLDFVHIISADQIIHYQLSEMDISSFTWLFSRIFHALILIFGVSVFLLQGKETFLEEYKSEKYFLWFMGFIFLLLSINAVLIVTDESLVIPTMAFPNALISHPFDLIPLALYLFAGIVVFPKFYKQNKNTFSQTLILSLIPAVIAQLHMAFGSREIYDFHFFSAQILKSVSYLVPFIGLTINYIHTYQNENKITKELDIQLQSNQKIQATLVGVLDTSLNGIMSMTPVKNGNGEVIDFEWTMLNHKAEVYLGYTQDQLIGNRFFSFFPNNHFLFEKYKQVYMTGKSEIFKTFSQLSHKHFEISVNKFANDIAVTFSDITNQILGQEAIMNYQRIQATSKFARLMTHEIRNPLTNILLSVEQLKDEFKDTDGSKIYIDILQRNTIRINELITEVMNASKLTDLNITAIYVSKFISLCVDESKDRLKLQNIELELEIKDDVIVEFDVEKMKIAILNIILNAIEAMNNRLGKLKIRSYVENDELIIKIIDNGIGISEENKSRLFEPFFTNKSKGFGIGLTASQTIIFNHHGTISLKSEVDKGSSFIVKIPVKARI